MALFDWFRRRRLDLDDDDFQEEIRAHLSIAEKEKIADGANPDDARYAALREFGNVTLTREATRRVWMPSWLEAIRTQITDIRHAIRALARQKTFSLTVIAVLTLGIGLNAAVFTMVKVMALAPVAGVDRSAHLAVMFAETSAGRELRVSWPDFQYLRTHHRGFASLFGSSLGTMNLGRGPAARQIWGELVTGNYFDGLGVSAALGRTLQASDEVAPGRHPVVVLSHGLWRRDFNADPAIVGRTVELNNVALTVVGVADPSFHGTIVSYDVEVFVPVMMLAELGFTGGLPRSAVATMFSDPQAAIVFPHGFLHAGSSMPSANAEADAIWTALTKDRPLADTTTRLRVVPFWKSPTGGQSYMLPTLVVLAAMGLLVLLIACANIAGLVLVRGVSRRGEIAVRLALGASRARLVRLLIVENLVLAVPGAALGLLLSARGIPRLMAYAEWLSAPQRIFFDLGVDAWVIGFAAFVAIASALVFGFVPALQSTRVDLLSVINEDASSRGSVRGRMRAALVVAQVAVSLLLLVGAGLATRTVAASRRADPGFDPNHVAAVTIDLKQNGYDEAQGHAFFRRLLDAVRADGGIEHASLAAFHPLTVIDTRVLKVAIDGYEPRRGEDLAMMHNVVSPDYFSTLRVPVVAGRAFEDRDDGTATPVAIVNATLAERYWGGASLAIGRRIRVADGDWRQVVGVAADLKYTRIDEAPRPYVYLPLQQNYRSNMVLYARGSAPVERVVEQTRAHVAALDANLPILSARSLAEATRGAFIFVDLMATMLFLFGTAGMVLAVMGTYGLVAYVVKQSTREIGIRIALGASALAIVRGFAARGLRLGLLGTAIGLVAALGVTRFLGSVLFGVSATDTYAFVGALAIVLGGVTLATIVPAWRASRTDALRALRHQ